MSLIRLAFLLGVLVGPAAMAQPVPSPRTDRLGVVWSYGERLDPITDRRELGLAASWRGAYYGLFCVQGLGMKMSLIIPGWYFMGSHDRTLRARVGRAEAFEIEVFGDSSDGRRATVRPTEAGRSLAVGLLEGAERLTLQNAYGESVILPLAAPRPAMVATWRARCREIAPRPIEQ